MKFWQFPARFSAKISFRHSSKCQPENEGCQIPKQIPNLKSRAWAFPLRIAKTRNPGRLGFPGFRVKIGKYPFSDFPRNDAPPIRKYALQRNAKIIFRSAGAKNDFRTPLKV